MSTMNTLGLAGSSSATTPSRKNTVLKIGHYTLSDTLGEGSFGKVKLGEHDITRKKVAVKILNRQKIKNLRMDEKIRREIQILKLFRHPHIIKLYEVIETATDIFLIMEYVSGGELFDYIVTNGRLQEAEAREFFQQIIAGVEYCHIHKVVHRDLKPENLLLDSKRCVKIGDFGLSNMMKDGDFMKTSCGSPNYAAPEVISGQLYAGPEVDVWSCGVILYALLTARLPFDDEYVPALFKKIREGVFHMPPYLSEACKDLLTRMLEVNPLMRITIAEIREHAWFTIGLPPYLAEPPEPVTNRSIKQIDQAILDELCLKFKLDKESALAALRSGKEGQLKIAYLLLYDSKHSYSSETILDPNELTAPGTPILSTSVPNSPHLTSSLVASSPSFREFHKPSAVKGQQQWAHQKVWSLGIVSTLPPKTLMNVVFNALSNLEFQWKVLGPYQLRVLCNNYKKHVKMGIQVFKVKEGEYLLDFKKLDGEVFPAFDACCQFICEFKKLAAQQQQTS